MTTKRLFKVLLLAGVLLPAGAAYADVGSAFKCHRRAHQHDGGSSRDRGGGQERGGGQAQNPKSIPEFDPASAGAIAALLTGGGMLLVRRRRVH